MKKTLYIAYGSNLNKEQMLRRCPDAEVVGVGTIPHYRLEFRRVLTVVPCPDSSVPVAVWRISENDEKSLDFFEGFPVSYGKQRLHIDFSGGTGCSAMAYVMNGGYLAPPSALYFNIVKQGYQDFGLDIQALYEALRASKAEKREF